MRGESKCPRNNNSKLFSTDEEVKGREQREGGENTISIAEALEWGIGWEGRC